MCGPPALALAAAAVTAAGSIYGGLQGQAMGQYQSAVAKQNARLADDQARDAFAQGQRDQQLLYRKVADTKGAQQVAMAANGIDTGFGSALDVQRDTAMLGAEDANASFQNSYREAKGYEINAANYRSEAQAARMRGGAAMAEGIFGAGSSILSGVSQYKRG
jgi:hypothetical protein